MNLDFTLEKYAQLCDAIQHLSCPVMTVKQFLGAGQPQNFVVVLRHDVDRALPNAMRMANLEAAYGIRATYYVRTTRTVFRAPGIRYLSRLGHEIGYHYEVLAKAKGNTRQAIAMFEQELEQLRQIVPVDTISMHGSPLTPWDNLDLWQTHDFKDYGLMGEAYLSINYSNLYYFTDTGRNWDADRYNLRDRAASLKLGREVATTDDLIGFLGETRDKPVLINAHPNRWAKNWFAWGIGTVSDWTINQVKLVISLMRQ
jgi:hypothetical protein